MSSAEHVLVKLLKHGFQLFSKSQTGVKYMKLAFFELKSEMDLGPLQHLG